MNRFPRIAVALGAGTLLVVLTAAAIAVASAASPADPRKVVNVTDAQAVLAVQRFAPDEAAMTATGPQTGTLNEFYSVQSAGVVATVDANTGSVLTFIDSSKFPASASVVLSTQQAIASAQKYADANGLAIPGSAPDVQMLDHGNFKEFVVSWTSFVNGIRTPKLVRISVDPATGVVFGFENFDRPFTTPPAPKLTLAEAVSVAQQAIGHPDATVTSSDLAISFDANGKQLLVYDIFLDTPNGFVATVQLDAADGTVLMVGRG